MSIIKLQNKGNSIAKVPSLYDKKQGGEPKTSSKGEQYVIIDIAPNHIANIDVCDATEEYIAISNGKLVDVSSLVGVDTKGEIKNFILKIEALETQIKTLTLKNEALEKENEAFKQPSK
jgi:hypothetical protein